jgi:hypothetical protein
VTPSLPDGERRIRVEFLSPGGCAPKPLELRSQDFQRAKEEVHAPIHYRRRPVARDR